MTARKTGGREMQEEKGEFLKGIKPVGKNKSMAEVVYKSLKNAIVNGDLKPGQRLVEQKLSDKMQVSRVPVREAIKRLEQYGFVARLPVRGIIVRKVSEEDVNEAFGIRSALESYAAYQACEHVDDEMIAALENSIESSFRALKKGDLEKVMELNIQFHEMIYRAAKSEMLYKLIHTFIDYIARYRKPLLSSETNAIASLEGHKAMVEAMRRGDKENVERIVKSHILQGRNFILQEMKSGRLD
jgi:DNA-binding GntR family transcriptional regulator